MELLRKWNRISLVKRIIAGLLVGTALGILLPQASFIGVLGTLFVGALKALAPLLVFFLVMHSLAQHKKGAKSNMSMVILLYLLGTFLAALCAVVASFLFPTTLTLTSGTATEAPGGIAEVIQTLLNNAVSNPVAAIVDANYIGVLLWAVVFGLAMRESSEHTKQMLGDVADMLSTAIRWVINCAGLGSDRISAMLGIDEYTLYPCRGEYYILDKRLSHMLPLPAYPVPNIKTGGLGIHLTPTLDGNIMVGPSTEYIDSREDYSATRPIMDMLIEDGSRIFPYLKKEYFIRNFAGIRPKLAPPGVGGFHDFVIERRDAVAPHAVNLVGIESPGLTSAVPIAHEVIRLMKEVEPLKENPAFNPIRRRAVTFRDKTPEEQARLIKENPDYGEIICRCETITKAEVLAAIRGPLGAKTVTGVKYRCRAMMGRCQGGYCQPKITELLMEEKGIRPEDLTYERRGSYLFTGEVRES